MLVIVDVILFAIIIAVLIYSYLNINKLQVSDQSIKNQITGIQKDVKGTFDSIDTMNKKTDKTTKETRNMLMNSTTNLLSNIDKTSTDNKNLVDNTASSLRADITNMDLRKGGSINGDINISGNTKTSVLKLGDKFSLSGVGDVNGNDQWLRLFNKDATGYADGGFAAKRIWANEGTIDGSQHVSGDLVFNGNNKWIVHTPDDGRKMMYIAPAGKNGDWDWDKQMNINNDGSVYMKQATVGTNMSVNGSQHVSGDIVFNGDNKWIVHTPDDGRKTMYIAPVGKNGDWDWDKQMNINNDGSVYMRKATVETDMSINGNLTMGPAKTLASSGRMHISGNELLYLLNKDGVIVGKEWGGNGNLSVQGRTTTNELTANKICIGSTCINESQLKKIAT